MELKETWNIFLKLDWWFGLGILIVNKKKII